VAQAVEWFAAQKLSKNQPAEQSEEMGAYVCPFTGAAQYGQKRCSCHERHEKVRTGDFFSTLVGEGGQHANDRKNCRGKTDKLMIWAVNEDVDQIAAGGSEKDGEEPKSSAGNPAEKMNEPSANEAVTQQVDRVGMQGKGSHQAPPFSIMKNAFPVSCPLYKPEGVFSPGAGYGKKEDQAAHQEKSWRLQ